MKNTFEIAVSRVANGLTIVARVDQKAQKFVAKDDAEAKTLLAEIIANAFTDQPKPQ